MRSTMARNARGVAAVFGLVTAVLALVSVGASIVAGGAPALALAPLFGLNAVSAALQALASLVVLVRGDQGRGAARVAAILLAGVALGYLPLVAVTSADAAAGGVVPATAAAILLVTSRGAPGTAGIAGRRSAMWLGRFVLAIVAVLAMAWAAVGIVGMATTAAGGGSGLGLYTAVRAAIVLGVLHAALLFVVGRLGAVGFLAAGAADVGLGLGALVLPSAWLLAGLLVAGVALLALGVAALADRSGRVR